MSRLPHRRRRLRQVDAPRDPRPGRGPQPLLRAGALAGGDQPAHALAAPAGARRGGHRRPQHLPRGAAAGRVRADREGRGAGAADRGHAPLRQPLAARRRARAGPPPAAVRLACKAACRRRSAWRGGKAGACAIPCSTRPCERLAAEAATRFTTLVASGDQIPFDVAEQAGPDEAFFHSYVPLTGRYVREREAELRSLPAFEPAREAVSLAGVAAPYLEQRGEACPPSPASAPRAC